MKQYAKVTPEGSRDLLFEECDDRRRVENALTGLYEANGYRKVITPTLEFFVCSTAAMPGWMQTRCIS